MSDLFSREAPFSIDGPAGPLQLAVTAGKAGAPYSATSAFAVLAHPHPQHGGTMHNKVVTTLMRCYRDLGLSVVRFNFRGVGDSGGEYDHCRGELDDMLAVVQAAARARPAAEVLLAGFSFGASVAARASFRVDCAQLTLVAPPVPRYDFGGGQFPVPLCVLQGDRDERVEEADVARWAQSLPGDVAYHRFADTGHFFHGRLSDLKATLTHTLSAQCPLEVLL